MDYINDRPVDEQEEDIFEDEDELMNEANSEEEEKDEAEQELERLVFGDTAGFKDELKGFRQDTYGDNEGEDTQDEEEAVATIADADSTLR